jgi:alpha-L-fucosidase 2
MKKRHRYCLCKGWMLICLVTICTCHVQGKDNLTLLFDEPVEANRWQHEGLPIGFGRLGAVIDGGIEQEHLFYSEISHWAGDSHEARGSVGYPRPFGDIVVDTGTPAANASDYRRQLDLGQAVHTVSYKSQGHTFTRESFCSYPDQVLVMKFTCSAPGQLSLKVRQSCLVAGARISASNHTIMLTGQDIIYNENKKPILEGMHIESQLRVKAEGGSVFDRDSYVEVKDADEVVLLLAAGTDFAQIPFVWRGPHPHKQVTEQLTAAAQKSYEQLKSDHIADYQSLFDRVSLQLETDSYLPKATTDARLKDYKANGRDLGMEELYFNFGRYLLIACSRPGQLPAHLQGVWNNAMQPPWHCDYHTDINVQMNYWGSEVANLAELHVPLFDFIESIIPFRRLQTQVDFKHRGWFVRTALNPVGACTWKGCLPANAWLARHFFEHYQFSQDTSFLRKRAYPLLKEVCEFWQDHLVKDADGTLVTPDGWSPEKPWVEPGIAFDQQLIADVFTNYIKVSKILDKDPSFRAGVEDMLSRLSTGLRIGRWGQLQERKEDLDDPNDKARHFSHLMCAFPLHQVSPLIDPAYAEAATVSLVARGNDRNGWNNAWKSCCFARLLDRERAYFYFRRLLTEAASSNLFNHAPVFKRAFQIEGNQGGVAAVAEMLLQSQLDELHLLPVLPAAWKKGSIHGLRARGGYTVDITWKDGTLDTATINAKVDRPCRLRTTQPVTVHHQGQSLNLTPKQDKRYWVTEFPVKAGRTYTVIGGAAAPSSSTPTGRR